MLDRATASVRFLSGEREPVRVATTANIALDGLQTIDGVALAVNDRVLVKDQTDQRLNGIWTASNGLWYRASDARFPRAVAEGVTVQVQEGETHGEEAWRFTSTPSRIGDDPIVLQLYIASDLSDTARLLSENIDGLLQIVDAIDGASFFFIRYAIIEQDGDDITALPSLDPPEAPGLALFSIAFETENAGPVTINEKPLLTNSGVPIPAGYLKAGVEALFVDTGENFRLLSYGDAEAVRAAAEEFAELSRAWAEGTEPDGVDTFSSREYSEKAGLWAEEAENVPVEPGLFSARHWALKAAAEFASGFEAIDVSVVRRSFVATSGQTAFSGADANSLVLAYTPGNEIVTLNGVQLARGVDYTATNGTSIILASGAVETSRLECLSFLPFNVADTYTKAETNALIPNVSNFLTQAQIGWGPSSSGVPTAADLNALTGSGVWSLGSGTLNKPSGLTFGTVIQIQRTATSAVQIATMTASGFAARTWVRAVSSGSGAWEEITAPERGSNANGEFVKFADGTMICWAPSSTTANSSTATGSLFHTTALATWTFPVVFVGDPPNVHGSVESTGMWAALAAPTTTAVNYRAMSAVSIATAQRVRMTAFGRWK